MSLTEADTILSIQRYIHPRKCTMLSYYCKCCGKTSGNLKTTYADLNDYLFGWYHCQECNFNVQESLKIYNKINYYLSPQLFGYNTIKILRSNGTIVNATFNEKFRYSQSNDDFIINVYWNDDVIGACSKGVTLSNILKLNPIKLNIDSNELYIYLDITKEIHQLSQDKIQKYCMFF